MATTPEQREQLALNLEKLLIMEEQPMDDGDETRSTLHPNG